MTPPTPAEIRVAGRALYGLRWQAALARDLGLRDAARLREWLRGVRPVRPGARSALVTLLLARAAEATRVAEWLDKRETTPDNRCSANGIDAGSAARAGSDILGRLSVAKCPDNGGCNMLPVCACALIEDAAAEIERLRREAEARRSARQLEAGHS